MEVALLELPSGEAYRTYIDPGRPILAEATEVHGITDAMVADAPRFEDVAEMVQKVVASAVLVSFCGRSFDTPFLQAELVRAGQPGLKTDKIGRVLHPEIDLYQVWIQSEARTLGRAAERFAGRKLEDAHSAEADTNVLPEVLAGMAEAFGFDPDDTDRLVEVTRPPDEIDRDGKFKKADNGRGGATAVFAFGKHEGQPVRDHLPYVEWMLGKDFSAETKAVARWLVARYSGGQTEMEV